MKNCLFVLMILVTLLFLPAAFALSISAADNVPENINWSFFVEFGSIDFWKTRVLLDSEVVLTAYAADGKVLADSIDYLPQNVVTASYADSKIVMSMVGLGSGSHTVLVKTFNADGSEKENAERSINVFEILGSSFKQETEENINTLETQVTDFSDEVSNVSDNVSSLNSSISSVQESVSELDSLLKSKEATIAELQTALDNVLDAVDVLELETEKLGSTDAETASVIENINNAVALLKKDLSTQKTELEDFTSAGFISFGKNFNPSVLFIPLAIIILLVVATYGYRKLKEEGTLFSSDYSKKEGTVSAGSSDSRYDSEDEDSETKGKWAFEGKTSFDSAKVKKEPDDKRFHLGDLIKKN